MILVRDFPFILPLALILLSRSNVLASEGDPGTTPEMEFFAILIKGFQFLVFLDPTPNPLLYFRFDISERA